MYCQSCGNKITDSAKFCGNCGAEVNAESKTQTEVIEKHSKRRDAARISEKNLCLILGIMFLIGGALPYIWEFDLSEYYSYIINLTGLEANSWTGIMVLREIFIVGNPLFYFVASFVSVLTGILILKGRMNVNKLIITNMIFQILSVVYSAASKVLVYEFPTFVMSLFSPDRKILHAGAQMIKEEPKVLYIYQDIATQRFVISVILIVLSLAVIFLRGETKQKKKKSIAGAITIMPILVLISEIAYTIDIERYSVYGNDKARSYFSCKDEYVWEMRFAFLGIIVCGLVLAFVFEKLTYRKKALLGSGVLILPFVLDCIFTAEPIRLYMLEAFLILSALFLWFCTVARGHIRVGMQIAIPILLLPVYLICEMMGAALEVRYISLGWIGVVIVMALTSILLAFPKKNSKIRRR